MGNFAAIVHSEPALSPSLIISLSALLPVSVTGLTQLKNPLSHDSLLQLVDIITSNRAGYSLPTCIDSSIILAAGYYDVVDVHVYRVQ